MKFDAKKVLAIAVLMVTVARVEAKFPREAEFRLQPGINRVSIDILYKNRELTGRPIPVRGPLNIDILGVIEGIVIEGAGIDDQAIKNINARIASSDKKPIFEIQRIISSSLPLEDAIYIGGKPYYYTITVVK